MSDDDLTLAEHISGLFEIEKHIAPEVFKQRCRKFLQATLDSAGKGVSKMRTCHTCWGEGEASNRKSEIVTCPICRGLGYVKDKE